MDGGANLKDRFMDAASLASNLNPASLFGKFNDEHEYYRTQKAEQADMALETPGIMEQTNGTHLILQIIRSVFTLNIQNQLIQNWLKLKSIINCSALNSMISQTPLDKIDSMDICNYVQFSGSWTIPDADVSIIEMMKAQFENGVAYGTIKIHVTRWFKMS